MDESSAMRDRILRAAADVFLEKGVDGFSMRQVAAKVGYSATTIYHHFVNKEDLLKAILDDVFSEFAETMRRAYEEESDPARRMGALGKAHVRFGLAHPVHYQLMYRSHPDWILGVCAADRIAERNSDHWGSLGHVLELPALLS